MKTVHSFHNLDYKIVLENLGTSLEGISADEVAKRQKQYGKNIFESGKKNNVIRTFFSQFLSPLIFILIFASLITIYLKEVVETVVIWSAILINVFFSTYQEYKAENTIEQLKKLIKSKALVKRDGLVKEVGAEELTVGDIVVLQYGSQVPADVRLIEVNDLKIDEAILTGESLPVEKNIDIVTEELISERVNYAFSGTYVTNGNGLGVVTHISENTEIGKIAKSITATKKVLTPVQTAIKNVSWYVFAVALLVLVLIFVLGVYRGEDMFEMLVLAAAIAVGAVPEALPIALTVILSVGVLNISKKGGLIRKLSAAETLGSTTLILTDKTGTLTEGNLKLESIVSFNNFNISNLRNFDDENLNDFEKRALIQASKNFSVTVDKGNIDQSKWVFNGNAFEVILSKIIHTRNLDSTHKSKIVLPFNSTNKYSVSKDGNKYVILGAPDILIHNSNLNEDLKKDYLEKIDLLSSEGKRIVAIAEKLPNEEFKLDKVDLIAVFVFSDLLRKGIASHIDEIVSKGVKVKIMTGDLPGTAVYIARQIGIEANQDEVLTGIQIENLTDDDLLQVISKIKIFARVTPEDKLRIGKLYQKLGEIVAMTGDGVNDSPSLKAMDIGISLSSGSEVAKSAADMILLKDDFKTIVDTISVGYGIKKNIQKVFVYLMSNSLDAVFVVTGSLVTGLTLPLTALQIIWVNILTGTLPALAFAYDVNSTGHKNISKSIFDNKVKFLAFGIGTFSSLLLFGLYFLLSSTIPDKNLVHSIFFLCFSIYILTISYSFVDLDKYIWKYNPFSNVRLNIGVCVGVILIFLTIYTPIGQDIFKLAYVPIRYLGILAVWIVFNIWVVEFAKFVYSKNR